MAFDTQVFYTKDEIQSQLTSGFELVETIEGLKIVNKLSNTTSMRFIRAGSNFIVSAAQLCRECKSAGFEARIGERASGEKFEGCEFCVGEF